MEIVVEGVVRCIEEAEVSLNNIESKWGLYEVLIWWFGQGFIDWAIVRWEVERQWMFDQYIKSSYKYHMLKIKLHRENTQKMLQILW